MEFDQIQNGDSGASVRAKLNGMAARAAPLHGTETLLFKLEGADLNSTADQTFDKVFDFTEFVPVRVMAMGASSAITTAQGGIYTAPSKGGSVIVLAMYAWGQLTSTSKVSYPTIANSGSAKFDTETIYLSLTTPMGSAATCDIYVLGFVRPQED